MFSVNALCSVECELEVVSAVVGVQLAEVKRVRVETVNECTKRQPVTPAARQVRHVHALFHQSVDRPIDHSINI